MPTLCQTVPDGGQFDGTATTGLFSFANRNDIPRTTRIVLTSLAYSTVDGGDPGDITFFAVRPGGAPTERVLLGRALSAAIQGPGTAGNVNFCGRVLPRNPSGGDGIEGDRQWEIQAFTDGKTVTGTVCIDYVLEPFPDTNPRDSE